MSLPSSKVELRFSDGSVISAFERFTLTERFLEPIDRGSFTLKPPRPLFQKYREKTQKGELVSALVDGNPQCVLQVQTQSVKYSRDGSLIELDCVSPLKVMQESSADKKLSSAVAADVPVVDLVLQTAQPFGIFQAIADDDTGAIRAKSGKSTNAKKTDIAALKHGEARVQDNETAYGFLARVVTRLGVIIRMDTTEGVLLLTRPHYDQDPLGTVILDGAGSGDRSLEGWEIVDSNEMQFDFCEISGTALDAAGETRANVPKARVKSSEINSQRPPCRLGALKYKPLFLRDTESRDKVRSRSTAFLALGLKADSAFYVRCQVHGLVTRGGNPWTVDTMYRVVSELYGLDEVMWLSERTFTVTRDGQTTDLVFVPKGYVRLGEA